MTIIRLLHNNNLVDMKGQAANVKSNSHQFLLDYRVTTSEVHIQLITWSFKLNEINDDTRLLLELKEKLSQVSNLHIPTHCEQGSAVDFK